MLLKKQKQKQNKKNITYLFIYLFINQLKCLFKLL